MTVSKFPGRSALPSQRAHLKSPSLLPEPSTAWLADRRLRDESLAGVPPHLHCIDAQLYDLSAMQHPGGQFWIESTRGTDCSDAYHTHHINSARAAALLKKFSVNKKVDTASIRCFDWNEDGFYATLRRKVWKEFGNNASGRIATGPTMAMQALCALALGLYFSAVAMTLLTGSKLWAFCSGYLLFVAGYGIGHNFFHQRDNFWMYAFNLTCFDVFDWKLSHCMSHHHYSNTDMDLEASAIEPWLNFMRNAKTNFPGVLLIWNVFNVVIGPLNFVNTLRHVAMGKLPLRLTLLMPLAQLSVFGAALGARDCFTLWLIMQGFATWLLMVFSTPVHRSDFAWTQGCEALQAEEGDFGKHVVLSTDDYMVEESGLAMKLFGFASFNDHVTHHLFPTIDLSQQWRVRALFLECCVEFHVAYKGRRFVDLAKGTARVLVRESGDLAYVK